MTDAEMKVTDKRMFTADGQLREEFKHLEDAAQEPADRAEEAAAPSAPEREPPPPRPESPVAEAGPKPDRQPPATPPGAPTILDLIGLLAEHTALYLGEVSLPDGQSMRDLRAAKLHLDLLDALRSKTEGNLTREESSVLEDILYRLRMLYVEKKRQGE